MTLLNLEFCKTTGSVKKIEINTEHVHQANLTGILIQVVITNMPRPKSRKVVLPYKWHNSRAYINVLFKAGMFWTFFEGKSDVRTKFA